MDGCYNIKQRIKNLYQLSDERFAYYSFVTIAKEILEEINNKKNDSFDNKEKQILSVTCEKISLTLNKEVWYIINKENEMKRKNAPAKRVTEHSDLIKKQLKCWNLIWKNCIF
ncbi:hypothetical protein [Ferruginibacter albus]|uniref:hypothetical protein n=1 Tax=Ferruginibacter albus TaxID=2875540 RepID=UPI001CC4CDC5|nr:hypothetical protein [Ferruginibacter albus]UAY52833.1 hypothetical protein K9M53_03930 [Ferruginibacter albus]